MTICYKRGDTASQASKIRNRPSTMYQNKHSVSLSNTLFLNYYLVFQGSNNQHNKDTVSDLLDRLKDEFNGLRSQLQNSRHEVEKQNHDRDAFHRQVILMFMNFY